MSLVAAINHAAVLTDDLDRFVEFYSSVFDVDVVFTEANPAFRHAILRTGPVSWLHPVEVAGNPHGTAVEAMFERGHLDHVALAASDYESFEIIRQRLVERGAGGEQIDDLGPFHSVWFEDPDGMRGEVVVVVDSSLDGIHEPRPLAGADA